MESLLETPFLSAATCEEITIADEEEEEEVKSRRGILVKLVIFVVPGH